ncbi:MAG: ISAzo13 family transposase, partial [Actinobacteria bacterium]|nr:ISAzo13 family transposase [Actinomycetota bacterium]
MRAFVVTDAELATMFTRVMPHLNERQRRIVAGSAARALGRGGIAAVSEATGMSRSTVQHAVGEVDAGLAVSERIRPPGAGRKPLIDTDPGLLVALDDLVEPSARGDPMSPLRWTAKSVRTLADELTRQGHPVSASKVGQLLREMEYSLQ